MLFIHFWSVVNVCVCLCRSSLWHSCRIQYLSHKHLKADRLMISMFGSGFISDLEFITRRTHTPLCAFWCYLWRDLLQTPTIFFLSFLTVAKQLASEALHWSEQQKHTYKGKTYLVLPVCVLPANYFASSAHLVKFRRVLFLYAGARAQSSHDNSWDGASA